MHVSTDLFTAFLRIEKLNSVLILSWNQQRLFELEHLSLVASSNDFLQQESIKLNGYLTEFKPVSARFEDQTNDVFLLFKSTKFNMLNLVRFRIEPIQIKSPGSLRYRFTDLRIWQETNAENFFKPRCVSCLHELTRPDTWGKNLGQNYIFQDSDISRKGTVYSRQKTKRARIEEVRYTPVFTFMSNYEWLVSTNSVREFIPVSIEPFQ